MSEQDELIDVIAQAMGRYTPSEMAWAGNDYHKEEGEIADALLAEGYGKVAVARAEGYRQGIEDARKRIATLEGALRRLIVAAHEVCDYDTVWCEEPLKGAMSEAHAALPPPLTPAADPQQTA